MKHFTNSLRITGFVEEVDVQNRTFMLRCRSGDLFRVSVAEETGYFFIKNFDRLDRDRIPTFAGYNDSPEHKLRRYIEPLRLNGHERLLSAYGIYQEHGDSQRFDAREVWLFHNENGDYLFEETHWWITQISALADRWLLNLFGTENDFDFHNYQTNLTYIGTPTDDPTQECATLSRLIYGLSSAYLMTGNRRYYDAARAGVEYQRNTFRTESHDGSFVVWCHSYDTRTGRKTLPSEFDDDRGAIPLYEQIYALAGLSQFYRISNDWETLDDMRRTLEFFQTSFYDKTHGGYYSHIDPTNFEPTSSALGDNAGRKNWNSIGDHTPAYLLNLMLATENIRHQAIWRVFDRCRKMQEELAELILGHFPDPSGCPYVRERFFQDWNVDTTYRWQKDRAVIGHNLKIAWNLTRIHSLLGDPKYLKLATQLADSMQIYGLDRIRGGWFDVVERTPRNGMPVEFAWHNRKAWWQQEQGILAYLVLYGATRKPEYLDLARESIAFWNMTYLDHDYGGVHFDVTDDGIPYTKEVRGLRGSHSKSAYHVFELNFLAQIYIRTFVSKTPFRLYFRPCPQSSSRHLEAEFSGRGRRTRRFNVMPDYLPKGSLTLGRVFLNGQEYEGVKHDIFQVYLDERLDTEIDLAVEYKPTNETPDG